MGKKKKQKKKPIEWRDLTINALIDLIIGIILIIIGKYICLLYTSKVPAGGNRGNNTAGYLYCNAENERQRRAGKLRKEHKFCKYHKYKFKLEIQG